MADVLGGSGRAAASAGVDAPDFGTLAWLRRASGDVRLHPWRLTPERLRAYAAGVHALARGGSAIEAEDSGAVLDPDRQPLLRPWESPAGRPDATDADPAQVLAGLIAERAGLSAALRPHVALDEFAAAQLKLVVCARALALLVGDEASDVAPERIRAWADAQQPSAGAEADFAVSLVTAVAGRAEIEAAFGS